MIEVSGDVYQQALRHKTFKLLHKVCLKSRLFLEKIFSKASGVLFIFVHISTGHAHFPNDKIHISCKPVNFITNSISHFLHLQCQKILLGKVCGKLPHPIFNLEKKLNFEPKFTGTGAYWRICFTFTLYVQAVFAT